MALDRVWLLGSEWANSVVELTLWKDRLLTSTERFNQYFYTTLDKKDIASDDSTSTAIERKRNLFTNQLEDYVRIETPQPAKLQEIAKRTSAAWELDIPPNLGYVYDNRLRFGSPHILQNDRYSLCLDVSDALQEEFRRRFKTFKDQDPNKYQITEFFFKLCSQPLPQVDLKELGIETPTSQEKCYLTFQLSRIANLPLKEAYKSMAVSRWITSMFHSYLRANNYLIPTSEELRRGQETHAVEGALTFTPKSGTYFNTVVLDFESLYPGCIDVYNLSHETMDCSHAECVTNKVPGSEHHVCQIRRGTYSTLIGALRDLRVHWFKPLSKDSSSGQRLQAEAASKLLKLFLVSSYDVTVRMEGIACPPMAEAITAYGRHALRTIWQLAEELRLQPLYGDTDSIFLNNPSDDELSKIVTIVKERLRLDVAIDKRYSVCVLSSAKKAYFGVTGEGVSDVKGLTVAKSNSPGFFKKVFEDCLSTLVAVKTYEELALRRNQIAGILDNALRTLRNGAVPLESLAYKVELAIDPAEKAKAGTIQQPYQCAIQLLDSGKKIKSGDTVSFIKVRPFKYKGKTFTVKPSELVHGFQEVNLEDYIRNLESAMDQVLEPLGLSPGKERIGTLD